MNIRLFIYVLCVVVLVWIVWTLLDWSWNDDSLVNIIINQWKWITHKRIW